MKRFRIILPIPLLVIGLALLFLQRNYMDEYPTHIHAWAEQDHYALALGFIDNGFDLFHPETMVYNKQFPSWWQEPSATTITSADFPIHEYVVALLMKLFGTTSPWVFRLWTLLWAMTGLLFVYRIAFEVTKKFTKSLFVTFVALCSPVFVYYSNGFLPSIPALTMGIIGLWFYLRYYEDNRRRHFHLGLAFLTVALLMRTTFAIELIAILCFELLRIIRKESTLPDKLPSISVSVAIFLAYFLWNRHLRNLHGTIFLGQLVPPENWQDFTELVADTYHRWTFHYFQRLQYLVVAALAITALVVAIVKKKKNKNLKHGKTSSTDSPTPLSLWWLVLIETFGCLLFAVAMMQQMPFHDYYLLDTFFLPFIFAVILLLRQIPVRRLSAKIVGATIAVILCFFWIRGAQTMQVERRAMENDGLVSYTRFKDADKVLDSLRISRDAKILCLYGYAQNGPFIQMGRKGYTMMWDEDGWLETALGWDYDYVVIENGKFSEHLDQNRELLSRLKKIGGNQSFSVCTPTNNWTYQEDWQFFCPVE
jgi:hypothetical protein